VPYSKNTKLLQDAGNKKHTSANQVDVRPSTGSGPVESQTQRQLVELSMERKSSAGRRNAQHIRLPTEPQKRIEEAAFFHTITRMRCAY
jgi:hypothetical protein